MADLKRFFKKTVSEDRHKQAASVSVPEGLWIKCPKCGEMVYREDVISNAYVCPKCGGYFRISAKRRIKMIADKGSFKEWFTGIDNSNPLDYPDYPQKIENLKEKTHCKCSRISRPIYPGSLLELHYFLSICLPHIFHQAF